MNKLQKIIIVALIVIIAVGALVFFTLKQTKSYKAEKSVIKIGAIIPLTGKGAYWGESSINGLQMAIDRINQEYGNQAMELKIEDSQSDSKVAVDAANKLINIDQVDFVYTELTGPSASVSPIVLQANKLYFYNALLPEVLEKNPLSIKTFLDHESVCQDYGQYAQKQGYKKIAIIGDSSTSLADYCFRGLAKSYQSADIDVQNIGAQDDVKTTIIKEREFQADAIVYIGYEASAIKFFKSKSELNWTVPVITVSPNVSDNVKKEIGLKNLDNTIYFETQISESFKQEYLQRFPKADPKDVQAAALAYDAIIGLYKGQLKCSLQDAQCIVNQMANHNDSRAGVEIYANIGRSLTPAVQYFQIKDEQIKPIDLK